MAVYSVTGERVRTLAGGRHAAGFYHATWDGRDTRGRSLAAGIYYCRFVTDQFSDTKKLIRAE